MTSTPFFVLAAAGCICAIICRLKFSRDKDFSDRAITIFLCLVLGLVALIYLLAAFSISGYMEPFTLLRNGSITGAGVFFIALVISIDAYNQGGSNGRS